MRDVLRILLLAALQGILIGVAMGVSLLIFLGRLDEYLIPACEFDEKSCQASLSRLLLPFPAPFLPNCQQNVGMSLTEFDGLSLYAKDGARSVNPSTGSAASRSAVRALKCASPPQVTSV
jgi:hypothetical protein